MSLQEASQTICFTLDGREVEAFPGGDYLAGCGAGRHQAAAPLL